MNRTTFLSSLAGAAVAASANAVAAPAADDAAVSVREGALLSQADLFASLPRPRPRDWTRIILGSGVKYQKQIGAGAEVGADGKHLLYYELQVGSPGGSCNPSTMRKAYLRDGAFGSLFATYPLISNIGRTENLVYRYGDVTGTTKSEKADTSLQLLDEAYLYDPRPMKIVSVSTARIHVSSRDLDATHVVAEYAPASSTKRHALRRVELWHSPLFPFGLAKYRAEISNLDPFEMHVYSHGDDFRSLLDLSLSQVRSITKDGQYGQLPSSVGA